MVLASVSFIQNLLSISVTCLRTDASGTATTLLLPNTIATNAVLYRLAPFPVWALYCFLLPVLLTFFSVALWPNAGHGLLILEVS